MFRERDSRTHQTPTHNQRGLKRRRRRRQPRAFRGAFKQFGNFSVITKFLFLFALNFCYCYSFPSPPYFMVKIPNNFRLFFFFFAFSCAFPPPPLTISISLFAPCINTYIKCLRLRKIARVKGGGRGPMGRRKIVGIVWLD